MAFLGIDQSLNATGLCKLSDARTITSMLTVDVAGHLDGKRLARVKQVASTLLEGVAFAALEGYSYGSTGRVFELGEMGGVMKLMLVEHGVDYIAVPPVSLKLYATGHGGASKLHMIAAANERFSASVADDNQADALFLADIARSMTRGAAGSPRHQLEVLASLRAPKKSKKSQRKPRRVSPGSI